MKSLIIETAEPVSIRHQERFVIEIKIWKKGWSCYLCDEEDTG